VPPSLPWCREPLRAPWDTTRTIYRATVFLRTSSVDRSYTQGVLRRGFLALMLAHLAVDIALLMGPIEDGWADDIDPWVRLVDGTLYIFVFLSMSTVVVTFACWAYAAWVAESRGEHIVGWFASLAMGVFVWWAFERFTLDSWSLAATIAAQTGAAAAFPLVVPRATDGA
jgi:hypothetical protein